MLIKKLSEKKLTNPILGEDARCALIEETFQSGTATFLILGKECSRRCRFCQLGKERPTSRPDDDEHHRIAETVFRLGLTDIIITSVIRDDLPDHGSTRFIRTIQTVRSARKNVRIEALIPDFIYEELKWVVDEKPDILSHHIAVVERLTPILRHRRFRYAKSLAVLEQIKEVNPRQRTKSCLLLGLGEVEDEIYRTMRDLISVGVDILVLRQYAQSSPHQMPLVKFYDLEEMSSFKRMALQMGFSQVISSTLRLGLCQAA